MILSRILGGIHWRATLTGYSAGSTLWISAGYLAGSTGGLLWWDTWRDPLAGGMHWLAKCTGKLLWDTQRDTALVGYSAGSTGKPLWRNTLHWQAALAGYSRSSGGILGSTGEPLYCLDTWQGPLASRSGGILGGIHWRAALGEIHWRAALAG